MQIRNLDKNIIYRLCEELQRRNQCGPIEAEFLYRVYGDIPSEHIAAHIQSLIDMGWLDADETRSMLVPTDRGRAQIRSVLPSKLANPCTKPKACQTP